MVTFVAAPFVIDQVRSLKRLITEQNLQKNNPSQEQSQNKLDDDAQQLKEQLNKDKVKPEEQ